MRRFGQEHYRCDMSFSVHCVKKYVMLMGPLLVTLTLGKVVSRIFHCKVTIFPFVIDNYLVGDGLKLLISCFSYFCLLILAPTGVVQNSY